MAVLPQSLRDQVTESSRAARAALRCPAWLIRVHSDRTAPGFAKSSMTERDGAVATRAPRLSKGRSPHRSTIHFERRCGRRRHGSGDRPETRRLPINRASPPLYQEAARLFSNCLDPPRRSGLRFRGPAKRGRRCAGRRPAASARRGLRNAGLGCSVLHRRSPMGEFRRATDRSTACGPRCVVDFTAAPPVGVAMLALASQSPLLRTTQG